MRVAVYHNNQDIRIEERPIPEIGPQELLVRVLASGICGSDVMEWYRMKKAPLVLGHEITGKIEKIGEQVQGYSVGDRVFVSHHVPCNTCRYCRAGQHTVCRTLHSTNFDPGGFAEFLRVPPINVDRGTFILPDGVSLEEGAFVEPLACVLRGQRIAGVKPQKTIAVLGSGISGILHIALARASGVSRIFATDVSAYRLQQAEVFGATAAFHANDDIPDGIRQANDGRAADVVVVCTGAPAALEQALSCVDRGGTILLFAAPAPGDELKLPLNEFWSKGVTLVSTYAGAPADCAAALELLANHSLPVADMITHRLPLEQIQEGFHLVLEGRESLKVIIKPQLQES